MIVFVEAGWVTVMAGRVNVEAEAVIVLVIKPETKLVKVEADWVMVTAGAVMVFVEAG